MKKIDHKKNLYISIVLVVILAIGIGYAYLTSNLSISGQTEIADNTWDIHFENLVDSTGNASIDSNDNTKVNYSVTLSRPGDKYRFTVDVVNAGTIDAMVSIVTNTGLTSAQEKYLSYSIKYKNGEDVSVNDLLDASLSDTIVVELEYINDEDTVSSDLPTTNQNINLVFDITYVQADNNANRRHNQLKPCNYNGTLTQGAEFVDGQYTYRYKQDGGQDGSWVNITDDGWGVMLTDKNSTAEVNTQLCSSINDKPVVSMNSTYYNSKATKIDLSTSNTSKVKYMFGVFALSSATTIDLTRVDTSNVETMYGLFASSSATVLDVSSFDTSKVTVMESMFFDTKASSLDLSNFDTSRVTNMYSMFAYSTATTIVLTSFDTSHVTDMFGMFGGSSVTSLDLSSFDTSNVTDMTYMFQQCQARTGYARTQADADRFNATSMKPTYLTFVVK